MKAILNRAKNILIHPKDEWKVIKAESAKAIFSYLVALAAVPLAISAIEALVFRYGAPGGVQHLSAGSVLMGYALWYLMIIVDVVILGAIISAFVLTGNVRQAGAKGFTIAAYTATPLLLVGIVISIPGLWWLEYAAVVYSVYLLSLGISTLMEIKWGKAAWYAVVSFLAASVIIGVLNLFEYLFESYLARTFISPG